ncbi:MAG: ribonuclease / adenosylcobalamin/alpha-ribazole phosphatase [Frankiales bacterium]|nr:ribonuclease / adenosylcobalamin/alpha-ribazole phosphatase [Frankiales bacterium]
MTLFDSTAPGLRVAIEADGGSRGNPGPAGYGAVVLSPAGEVLAEAAEAIGRATNNVAEYRGLIAGLDAALALGATQVDVRMDSKLVVEQMSGRWQIKHPDMKPLALQAKSLVRQFDKVSFAWIPRERNKHADRLANEAMDDAAAGRTWSRRVLSAGADSPVEVATTPMRTASLEPPTTLVLLRHGETRMSVEKRFSGPTSEPLTARGEAMAEAAAARLAARRSSPIEAIVCSPVARAVATAAPVAAALDLDVIVDDGLREVDFGDWDGYTFAEVQAKWPAEMAAWLSDADVAPPHGESMAGCGRRVRQSRDRILAAHPGRTVLVVSHVTPIKTLVRIALDAPVAALFRMHLDLASLSEIAWYADGPATLRSYNETFHLEGLET